MEQPTDLLAKDISVEQLQAPFTTEIQNSSIGVNKLVG